MGAVTAIAVIGSLLLLLVCIVVASALAFRAMRHELEFEAEIRTPSLSLTLRTGVSRLTKLTPVSQRDLAVRQPRGEQPEQHRVASSGTE